MSLYAFPDVNTLIQSVGSHLLPGAGPRTIGPGGLYTVDNCSVVFVAKRKTGEPVRVALKRVDWHTLTAGQRFRATLLGAFGLAMGKRTYLSCGQAKTYLDTVQRAEQEVAPIRNSQRSALDCIARRALAPVQASSALIPDVPEGSGTHVQNLARIHAKVVEEFGFRLKYILPAVRELYIHRPTAVAREVCQHALAPLQRELEERLDELQFTGGMSEGERIAIKRELGWEQCIARCERVSQEHIDPASRKIAMSLAQVEYNLDEIPAPQLHLDQTADAVLGDLHGNCRLLLHSLIALGFFTIKNRVAWQAITEQLRSLETEIPDNEWRTFRERLLDAIEPAPSATDRKLRLIGDVLGDRRGNDMFMAAILAHMDASKLDFELMGGNHEGEFLSYFLKNRDKEDQEAYSFKGAGVGMRDEQCLSLDRLHTLLNLDREARAPFKQMVADGLLKHLKLASFSRDGKAFYSHAFTNGSLVPDLLVQAGVNKSSHITEQIRELNDWFQQKVLLSWETFVKVYHTAQRIGTGAAPVSPLRAIMWNIGMEMGEYADDVSHPHNAGIEVPDGFKYAVHGHCGDVASRVRGLVRRAKETEQLVRKLRPLTGKRRYLPTINRALAEINSGTDFNAIKALGPFIVRGLRDVRENKAAEDLIQDLRSRAGNVSTLALALSDFWNSHCTDGKAPLSLDFSRLGVEVQRDILNAVWEWLQPNRTAENWKREVDLLLANKLEEARGTSRKVANAIRQNLFRGEASHGNKPASAEELHAYTGALKGRFFSIDDPKGSKVEDVKFSRLVHLVPRRPYGVRTRTHA